MENTQPGQEQPASQDSMADRIANIFDTGPDDAPTEDTAPLEAEEAPAEEPTAEAPEAEFADIQMDDGEVIRVPKKYEKNFMLEKDYTQKSQKIATERRTLEHLQSQLKMASMNDNFRQSVSNEVQQLQMLDAVIKQRQSMDWTSVPDSELMRARLELDQFRDQKAAVEKSISEKQAEFQKKITSEARRLQEEAMTIVKQKIPEWNGDVAKQVREHGLSLGLTNEELDSISDPRHVEVLYKAMKYDALRAKAQPATQQAKAIKTTPNRPMPQAVKNKLAFDKAIKSAKPGTGEYNTLLNQRIMQKFAGR